MREWPLREPRFLRFRGRGVPFSSDELRELPTEPPADFVESWFAKASSDPRARLVQGWGSDQTGGQFPQRLNERWGEVDRGPIN